MYLKDEAYYSRQYDELTVKRCRRIEDHFKESISKYKAKIIGREQLAAEQLAARMLMYFESGGEYLEKERTIIPIRVRESYSLWIAQFAIKGLAFLITGKFIRVNRQFALSVPGK